MNADRIDTLISHLIGNAHHKQMVWISGSRSTLAEAANDCGTTACAAGWTALLFEPDRTVSPDLITSALLVDPDYPHAEYTRYTYAQKHIFHRARRLLGLTVDQATFVFLDTNGMTEPEESAILALKYLKDHPDATRVELMEEFSDQFTESWEDSFEVSDEDDESETEDDA